MKPDERDLWNAIQDGTWPRVAGVHLGIHPKRVQYLCLKWSSKGIYDYGTSCDMGWVVKP